MKNRYKQAVDLKKRRPLSIQMRHRLREGGFLIAIACAVFLFVSFISYHVTDRSWSSTGLGHHVINKGGRVGAWIADVCLSLFGVISYLFPFLLILASWLAIKQHEVVSHKKSDYFFKSMGWFLFITSCCVLASFYLPTQSYLPAHMGGIWGDLAGRGLALLFNRAGSTLFLLTTLLAGITLVTGLSWLALVAWMGGRIYAAWLRFRTPSQRSMEKSVSKITPIFTPKLEPKLENMIPVVKRVVEKVSTSIGKNPKVNIVSQEKPNLEMNPNIKLKPGSLPSLTLLNAPPPSAEKSFSNISFEALSQLVEQH